VVSSFFTLLDLPEYYDDKLLLRVVREPSLAAGTATFAAQSNALSALQDEGLILKLIPLSSKVRQAQCLPVAVGGRLYAEESSPETVTSVAELKPGNLKKILRQLKDQDGVEAERLPVRYLCATPAAMPPRERPLWNLERIQW